MAERILREYGVATHYIFDLWDYTDFRTPATITPATGDAKISKDDGSEANVGTLFTAQNDQWKQSLSAAEMQCAQAKITYKDQDGPVFVQRTIYVETYGGPSSQHGGLDSGQAEVFAIAAGTMPKFTVGSGSTTTIISLSALSFASAGDDQFVPRAVFFASDTTTAVLRGLARKVLSFDHSAQEITVDTLPTSPVSGDYGVIS